MRSENQIASYGAVEEGEGENGQVYNPTPSDSDLHGRQEKVKSIRHFLWNSLLYIAGSAMIALFLVAFRTSDSPAVTSTISNVYSDRAPTGVLPPLKVAGVYGKAVEIAIVATNEYGQFAQKEYYPWMNEVPGTQLVEPYKETALTLVGSVLNSGATYNWKWSIENFNEDGSGWMKEGKFQTTQKLTFTKTGIYNITVQAQDSAGNVVHGYSTRLICKYVKRELRTLTEADRDRFLDAAIKLWKINSNKGIQLYGSEYVSIDRLVAIHSLASNDIMCDGFHEGSGFLTHHLALTNSFEASLRAVDPSVTLPYWDFTIEGEAIQKAGKTPSYMKEISPAFTDEWFGSVDENNHIVDSRWARTKMPKQTDPNGVRNSYGYIRSYWNNNNESEISRRLFKVCGVEPLHKTIPSCNSHFDVLNTSTLADFQTLSPGDGHGPMHVQLGGMWGGCDEAYQAFYEKWAEYINQDLTDADIEALGLKKWRWGNVKPRRTMLETAIVGEYFHIYRSFWRSHMCAVDGTPHLLVCPDSCSQDVPFEECSCQVDALVNGETTWENLFPCVLNSEDNRNDFQAAMPTEMLSDMVYMLATASVKEGEMIESASTADILFWVIHPTIERLMTAKRLRAVTKFGSREFIKWQDYTGASEEWLEYSYYSFGKDKNPYYPDEYICVGHGADDKVLPDSLKLTDAMMRAADTNDDHIITNMEFFLALDPNNVNGVDYVFDNFQWDHCS